MIVSKVSNTCDYKSGLTGEEVIIPTIKYLITAGEVEKVLPRIA